MKIPALLLGIAIAAPLLGYAALYAKASLFGNIHALPGKELYRSGQLSYSQLQDTIARHNIHSVINLRGPNVDMTWYQDEVMLSQQMGVTHIDYPLSSKRPITEDQAKTLLTLIRNAPKPLLIHCQHGADRTGVASALYVKYILNQPTEDAWHQLSWQFTHTSAPFSDKDPMDVGFERIINNPNFASLSSPAKGTSP